MEHKNKRADKIHVAIVDDEPRIHEMIRDVLAKEQIADRFDDFFEPFTFLEFLKQTPPDGLPDIVLLDVNFENAGLSGIDILPFIREDHPFLPVVLLTGMEGEEIEDAQEFECTYFIPKPVSPDHLVKMIRFYLGKGKKSAGRIQEMNRDLDEHRQLLDLLESELKQASSSQDPAGPDADRKGTKPFERFEEVLLLILKNTRMLDSFRQDLKKMYFSDFNLLKKAVETLVQLDLVDTSTPGTNIHKYYGVDRVFTIRLSRKVRIFYFQPPPPGERILLRLDPGHDTKGMEKWLKSHYKSYADGPLP